MNFEGFSRTPHPTPTGLNGKLYVLGGVRPPCWMGLKSLDLCLFLGGADFRPQFPFSEAARVGSRLPNLPGAGELGFQPSAPREGEERLRVFGLSCGRISTGWRSSAGTMATPRTLPSSGTSGRSFIPRGGRRGRVVGRVHTILSGCPSPVEQQGGGDAD